MKKSLVRVSALAVAALLGLSACAEAPTQTQTPDPGTSPTGGTTDGGTDGATDDATDKPTDDATEGGGDGGDYKACMVSDFGGFDDKSFNETSYAGLLRAEKELGIEIGKIESNSEPEYAGNIQSMIDAKCNIIVTVGFALATATEAAAKQNPDINFAIVDNSSFEGVTNAKGLLFNAAEPAFLAGYAAAAMTQTGTVGTFGGAPYPTVTIFMTGFAQGVAHYNEVNGKDVKVLGWDETAQDGQFIGGADPFGDIPGGKNTANTLISQGADIILPVAGPAGIGALQAAQESGGKVNAIWVDTDGTKSASEYADVIITSVEKGMDVAVFEAIKAAKEGSFDAEAYVGTLENEGAKISPFHSFESKLPDGLQQQLDEIKQKIISGEIKVKSPLDQE